MPMLWRYLRRCYGLGLGSGFVVGVGIELDLGLGTQLVNKLKNKSNKHEI